MGIADDMKILTEDIVASYGLRVKTIRELEKDTHDMLKGFQSEHRELEKDTNDMLKGFQSEHKKMADELRKTLAEENSGLMNQFQAEDKDRIAEREDRNKVVAELLDKFAKDHEAMADELRKTLAEENSGLMNQFQAEGKDRISEREDRNKVVLDLLQGFKTEREKMAASWQALTAAMAKKSSIKPKVTAEGKVRSVKEAKEVKEVKEVKEEMKEDKPSSGMDLEGKVLEFIVRHPEGVRVGEMEEPLGVLRMRLGVIAKVLLEKGKVRKEENVYFPIL